MQLMKISDLVPFLVRCFFVAVTLSAVNPLAAREIYLSPDGDDTAVGSREFPLKTLGAAVQAVAEGKPGPGKEPITVNIRGGRYPITQTVTLGKELVGTKEHPIRFQAVEQEVPVFDAGVGLSLSEASLVEDSAVLKRLPPSAKGKVYSLVVEEAGLRKALTSASVRCSVGGRVMRVARYPNVGYAHVDGILERGAVYAHGRTEGTPPRGSVENPIGGRFVLLNKDTSAWEKEYQQTRKAKIVGYLSHDWYREQNSVASVKRGEIQLTSYSRYGLINPSKVPRRVFVTNFLCELDAPGEFYFDEQASTLYFMPPAALNKDNLLSIWSGPGLALFRGASYVSLEGVVVEGVGTGKAAVVIEESERVVLAGCTVRNSSRPAVRIEGGQHCGLRSCDIYDVPDHLTLDGGNVRELEAAGHFATNCHFTQIDSRDFYGRIRIQGVGHIFRNNLVHNFPGQPIVFGDCDHRFERNEFFNNGYEEGDGGTLYSGAAMWSWGNEIRHNFIHHLMCMPQLHPRGGIYPDDLDQGETIEGNVFYKAAHRTVLLNGGAGHRVLDNLFLKGHIGIYNTETYAEQAYQRIAKYESGELKRGDKDDRIYRTEQVVGPEGWNEEPWSSQYPLFRKIMNQEKMRFYPIECEFIGNRFADNWRNIGYRVGSGDEGFKPIEEVPFIRARDNRKISMRAFRDPQSLDFRYDAGVKAGSVPKIPFEKIGLAEDEAFRPTVPNKHDYRRAVRRHYAGRLSYDPRAKYDPETINTLMYFNTGRLLAESGGMLHFELPQHETRGNGD